MLRGLDYAGEMIVGPAKTLFLDEISTGKYLRPSIIHKLPWSPTLMACVRQLQGPDQLLRGI